MEGNSFWFAFEPILMQWLQQTLGAGASVISLFSALGEETILVAILGILYWWLDKSYAKAVGTNIVIGITWNPLLKNVVLRRRPYMDHSQIQCLRPVEAEADIYDIAAQGYSFPSGHSTNSAIVYGALSIHRPQLLWLRVLAFLLPFLVGISRVAVGVHYPTDVLCGWAFGGLVLLLNETISRRVKNQHLYHLVLFAISLIGMFYCRTSDYFTSLGIMGGFFLALPFEEKVVRFENTKNPVRGVLRVAVGFVLYFGINTLLKVPFSSEFLASGTMAAFLVRTLRYLIVTFSVIGLYPLLFAKMDRFWNRDEKKTAAAA